MSNTADTGQSRPSVVAEMAKRSAPEAPAATGQETAPNAGQSEQGANTGQPAQNNGGNADDLSKLTTEQLVAKLKEEQQARQSAREEADRLATQHKKVLRDWNAMNMKAKTAAERGEISSKAAKELAATGPGIDPENPFGFLQRDNAEKHLSTLEQVMPEARYYLTAFMQNLQNVSVDEAEQIAREMLAEDDDGKRIALAIKKGKTVLPEAKLALMQRVAKAGDAYKVIEEVEQSTSVIAQERDTYKARVAELEAQLAQSVPSRAPLRSGGEPSAPNASGDGISDKPLGIQIQERQKARMQGRMKQ